MWESHCCFNNKRNKIKQLTDASTPSSPIKVSALRYLGHLRMHESPEIGNNYFKMAVELVCGVNSIRNNLYCVSSIMKINK